MPQVKPSELLKILQIEGIRPEEYPFYFGRTRPAASFNRQGHYPDARPNMATFAHYRHRILS